MQDKILKIAKGLGISLIRKDLYTLKYLYQIGESEFQWRKDLFNPYENDADAFKVLQVLIAKCDTQILHSHGKYSVESIVYSDYLCSRIVLCHGSDKNLKAAICEAYLSLIQQEEG